MACQLLQASCGAGAAARDSEIVGTWAHPLLAAGIGGCLDTQTTGGPLGQPFRPRWGRCAPGLLRLKTLLRAICACSVFVRSVSRPDVVRTLRGAEIIHLAISKLMLDAQIDRTRAWQRSI